MKLITFRPIASVERLGAIINNEILDIEFAARNCAAAAGCALPSLPDDIISFLRLGETAMSDARKLIAFCFENRENIPVGSIITADTVTFAAPVPRPASMRDGYAFRQHVEAARRNRGVEMIPEFDEIPIFYFTNHQAVYGPGDIPVLPLHEEQLDFELECAVVIGKQGRNIAASEADSYIAGLTVMNDWSARALQMKEMKLNLGPAKGKDFATSLGPWLLTLDELEPRITRSPNGAAYNLEMTCRLNGQEVSRGNVKDMTWTFAQIIERASYGVTLYPGDVIGSGTCGTGCFLELNGSKVFNPPLWIKPGDIVECEIESLGTLTNRIVREVL
ncbi:fumarylacetoacetate hydrolase family protein [Ignavibacteria bacterium]|nr:fumarylacetoacetate hydrolase family protein [Bacteroidota bacterium]MCZ2132578.1 fumarylacetoacetate hydrolase family protein [Bacteroidota bacterium]